LHWILAGLWLIGGLLRIYRQARFFQIEEYQNARYWRWLIASPARWEWQRPAAAWIAAAAISFLFSGQDALLLVLFGVVGVIAIWPAPQKEVKKTFVRTQRATRLLVIAWLAFGVASLAIQLVLSGTLTADGGQAAFVVTALAGTLLFLLSPLFLIVGNLLAIPVEAGVRQGYLRRARGVLRDLAPTVIGITGSYGKTSTKHYLAHILNGRYRTVATPKSYNTLMGVTLAINTVLKSESDVDYFIVEMGAYIEGEIAEICRLAQPQISIVTAVGPQHLERFGSLEAVTNAKYEIVAALPADGAAILNGDDPRVRSMADRTAAAQVTLVSQVGDANAGFTAENIQETVEGLSFDVIDVAAGEKRHFHAPLYGIHNVSNLLLATAAARQVGLPLGEIAMRVAGLEPFEHRLQRKVQPGGLIVLDDAYSANPVGARSALHVLGLHTAGKRILITPGMVELGELQDEENRKLGVDATQYATDIVLVGIDQTRSIYNGVMATDFDPAHLHVFDTHVAAVAWLRENALVGDTVLFLNDLPDTYL
jgi:UDP-N-acetylmuramoyl-tripeptide--D-alanyl-D-alanine ligase